MTHNEMEQFFKNKLKDYATLCMTVEQLTERLNTLERSMDTTLVPFQTGVTMFKVEKEDAINLMVHARSTAMSYKSIMESRLLRAVRVINGEEGDL